jgi:ubiquinone/menaquinone biosynthesis C-methylase UbiE
MSSIEKIKRRLLNLWAVKKETAATGAYNLWAADYDSQPDNLMLALDEEIFTALLADIAVAGTVVVDVGCGTGRHWKKILSHHPKKITGFDVSENMLAMLQQKFPGSETYIIKNNLLQPLQNNSCQLLISTLTIAHIENAPAALLEWTRVLAPGGSIIITDYHPAALAKGAQRSFKHNNKTLAIKNYVHPVDTIIAVAKQLNLQDCRLIEKNIDDSMRQYYEKQNALHVFEKWKGTPVIYGLHLKKADDTA